jgi:8-oxo-dGTP diphosphatase
MIQLSGCAIIKDAKLLLLEKINEGHLEFPGGKVEPGETLEEAAIRECKEEIGVTLQVGRKVLEFSFDLGEKKLMSNIFLATLSANQEPSLIEVEKFSRLVWFDLKNPGKEILAPNVKALLQKTTSDLL